MTSATLDDGSGMSGFCEKVGASGNVTQQELSPFDYERQMRVFITEDAPAPSQDRGRLNLEWLAETIRYCCLSVDGGTLVLWTSYRDMNEVAREIAPHLKEQNRQLLLQGRDGSRSELAQQMREKGNAVLFGTDSFWNGIDIQGPALSQVIITRLPFENPSHPMAEARSEWLQAQNKNPFVHQTLPDALIQFRQGLGRLIRSQTDHGTLTLLDSRLLHREYGKRFLDALPLGKWQRFSRSDRTAVFKPLEINN